MIFKKVEKVVGLQQPAGGSRCAIDRVLFKVTKSSVKSMGNPHTAKFDRKLSILKAV